MAVKRAPVATVDDDGNLGKHTGRLPVGRVRPATLDEDLKRETLFRPDCVLALTGKLPGDLGAFEQHIASLVDGVRPVARIKTKSGVSSADLRIALQSLVDRNLLRVAGIVEIAPPTAPPPVSAGAPSDAPTVTEPMPKIVPAHVMAEIQAMLDDEAVVDGNDKGLPDTGDD